MKQHWKNRIVGHADVDPETLVPNKRNWRRHPKHQADALDGVLTEVGTVQSVIVNKKTGRLVDGHLRLELALKSGQPTVPVVYVELEPEEEALVLATLDPVAALAEADSAKLDELLRDVTTGNAAVMEMVAELAKQSGLYFGEPEPQIVDAEPQIDRAEELRVKWGVETGQLWRLGDHRLLCGDSTRSEDIKYLMDGVVWILCVTSPPYNQKLDTFTPSGMHTETNWVKNIQIGSYFDSKIEHVYQDEQVNAISVWIGFATINASIFYNHKNRYRNKQVVSPWHWLSRTGLKVRQEIIWYREGSVTQNARMFMPCDERIFWLYIGDDFFFNDLTEHKTWSSVWKINSNKDRNESMHGCSFPIELVSRPIRACSSIGDVVFDPYCGSGTTIIAAEQLGRKCYAIEIEPKYVAVTLQRWADATGKTPELERS